MWAVGGGAWPRSPVRLSSVFGQSSSISPDLQTLQNQAVDPRKHCPMSGSPSRCVTVLGRQQCVHVPAWSWWPQREWHLRRTSQLHGLRGLKAPGSHLQTTGRRSHLELCPRPGPAPAVARNPECPHLPLPVPGRVLAPKSDLCMECLRAACVWTVSLTWRGAVLTTAPARASASQRREDP